MKTYQQAFILVLLLLTPFVAKANMIWPSLYIMEGYYVWYVILIALVIEIIAARIFLKLSWKKSVITMFTANLISALTGYVLIPASGILVELLILPFGGGTFQLSHWILDYIMMVLVNTCVEGLALRIIFKIPFKPNFWWLFVANLISVIVSLLCLLF